MFEEDAGLTQGTAKDGVGRGSIGSSTRVASPWWAPKLHKTPAMALAESDKRPGGAIISMCGPDCIPRWS